MGLEGQMIGLGAIAHWMSGGTPSRSIPEYWDGDIPWISASSLRKVEVTHSDQRVTPEAVASGSKMAPLGATLLLVRGSALHNEIRAGLVCQPVCFNQDVKALVPKKNIDPKFLTYSILGRQEELLKLVSSAGNTAGVLDTKLVQGFKIWVPEIEEQRAITTTLSDVDALLEGLDRLIAKKRDLRQAAMQQLLTGQTRLPGFEGGWEVKSVAELEKQKAVKLSRGKVISKKDIDRNPGSFPIYSSSVHNDGLFGCYGDFMFNEELITWSVDGGGNFFHRSKHKFSVTNVCGFMRVDISRMSFRFLAAQLQLLHSQKSFDYQSKAHPSVVRKEYEVCFPPLPEQTVIAKILSDMDAEIDALGKRRVKTAALKQAMMQDLLTGRTRLKKSKEGKKTEC